VNHLAPALALPTNGCGQDGFRVVWADDHLAGYHYFAGWGQGKVEAVEVSA